MLHITGEQKELRFDTMIYHEDIENSIMDDYATVYLFFRWLYLQASPEQRKTIFYEIETSSYYDYRAITDVAQKINSKWGSWETLLGTWLAANYYPKNTAYGYKGDTHLQGIKVKAIADKSAALYPGEGVYSSKNGAFTPSASGENIRYAGLTNNSPAIDTSSPYSGNILLTFNANTALSAPFETGSLTGITPHADITPLASKMVMNDAQDTESAGPFVIDAQDLLGRGREPVYNLPLR